MGRNKRRKLSDAVISLPAPDRPVHFLVAGREFEIDVKRRRAEQRAHSLLQDSVLSLLQERQFYHRGVNKLFACHWLNAFEILMGSKDNKLLRLDVSTGTTAEIPLPSAPPRTFVSHQTGWGKCGIHCIAASPSGDLIATGGEDPSDCVVLRTSDWSPVATLMGHRDWLFGAAWVSDRHVVTGSRDKTVALWTVDGEDRGAPHVVHEYSYDDGSQMKRKYDGKVREVKFSAELGLVAALSTEGSVKLQDPGADLRVTRSIHVPYNRELVAMALRHDLVAVGSLSHVVLADPRKRDPHALITSLASPDLQHGVRSICIADNLLSFGTGMGKIAFYDLRAAKFVPLSEMQAGGGGCSIPATQAPQPVEEEEILPPPPFPMLLAGLGPAMEEPGEMPGAAAQRPAEQDCLKTGRGWVEENLTFLQFFYGQEVKHACYAHAWDPSGTRLFMCGGPLAFGLAGGYMALWE